MITTTWPTGDPPRSPVIFSCSQRALAYRSEARLAHPCRTCLYPSNGTTVSETSPNRQITVVLGKKASLTDRKGQRQDGLGMASILGLPLPLTYMLHSSNFLKFNIYHIMYCICIPLSTRAMVSGIEPGGNRGNLGFSSFPALGYVHDLCRSKANLQHKTNP